MSRNDQRTRHLIAEMAARLIAEQGDTDLAAAKRKAAHRLGVPQERNWPKNQEIEQALRAYQSLFHQDDHQNVLYQLRSEAVRAMDWLAEFDPHLTGPLLEGAVGRSHRIELHIFSDTVEAVALFFRQRGIDVESGSRRVRLTDGTKADYPEFRFVAGDTPFSITVFPVGSRSRPPADGHSGRAIRRVRREAVLAMLESPDTHP